MDGRDLDTSVAVTTRPKAKAMSWKRPKTGKGAPDFQSFLLSAADTVGKDDEKELESLLSTMGLVESKVRVFDVATVNSSHRDALSRVPAVWYPKTNAGRKFPQGQVQRCPLIWVDQLTFTIRDGQLLLALGVVDKTQTNGIKSKGLVLPGGGHVETLNDRTTTLKSQLGYGERLEEGHASIRDAADKELHEEMKINPKYVIATKMVAIVNRTRQDLSKQGVSYVFLRAVHGLGSSTSEVKTLVYVKMSELDSILKRETYEINGEDVPFTNGHKELIQLITALPETAAFCTALEEFAKAYPAYGRPPADGDDAPPGYK